MRPRTRAVLRLMTSSNLDPCSTGKSAGLAPFKILSTYDAAPRMTSGHVCPIGHQATGLSKLPRKVNRRQAVSGFELHDPSRLIQEYRSRQDDERASALLGHGRERPIEIVGT